MDSGVDEGGNGLRDREKGSSRDRGSLAVRPTGLQESSPRSLANLPARPIVVVLGMHRSGTSLLSNALHLLGVDMADATDHISPKNAGGFWERPALMAIQDEILAAIGRPISQPSHALPFPPAWWRSKEVQALKPKLIHYLQEQLDQSSNPWGFKDPRTCRLLPLWKEVFRDHNLEPVYVVALRTPSESSTSMSQKSSARRLSVGTSELMWLSYNYDIARYVTSKTSAVTVDYEEWFGDPVEVARRLTNRLGIGLDLTSEEISECMTSLVRGEYRHQFDGQQGVASSSPLATMLYDAMSAHRSSSEGDAGKLRAQIRLVDLFFKSMTAVTLDLDAATRSEAELRAARDEVGRARDEAEQKLSEMAAKCEALHLEKEQTEQRTQAVETERQRLAEARAEADRNVSELATRCKALQREKEQSEERRETLETECERLVAAAGDAEQKLAARQAELEAERDAAHRARAELDQRHEQSSARLQVLEAQLIAAGEDLERATAELAAARSETEATRAKAGQMRRRSRQLVSKARDWRDRYKAEHGEPDARLAAADLASAAHRSIMSLERRIAAAEERNARLIAELEARDRSLEAIAAGPTAAQGTDLDPTVFVWPAGQEPALEVQGRIDRVDEFGIVGRAAFTNRPEIAPVVEVRVNGSLVHAQSCLAGDPDAGVEAGGWRFFIPWRVVSPEHAGGEAIIVASGVGQELGRSAIPLDLHTRHLPPPVRASKAIGGTVAQAAEYQRWIAQHETSDELRRAREYRSAMTTTPLITVVVYRGDAAAALLTLESLQAQINGHWEAIFVDGPADLEERDPRVRTVKGERLDGELDSYQPDSLFTFVEAGDSLSPTALLHLSVAASQRADFALIYSDEDRIDARSGLRADPHMKGEWSPDLALVQDYPCRLALVRRDRMQSGIPSDFSALYELVLRAAMAGAGPIVHLPFVLYHRLAERQSYHLAEVVQRVLDDNPAHAGAKAIDTGPGRARIVWPLPDPLPLVSLIVPTRDRADLLRVCVDGFLHETRYPNLEVLIADNDSAAPATKAYLEKVATHPRVRVIPCPGPFNFSRINNLAASQAKGHLIGLMNNDLKVLEPNWLRELVAFAMRPDIGIVGAKLLHGDGTIQHAGVTLGIGIASHLYKFAPGSAEGHRGRLALPQDLSAVTAACLLMRRDVWDQVGGLDEEFPVAYNDIDLCLRVREAGYRIVWNPDALMYHLESQSRGKENTPEKRDRLNVDKTRMQERWGGRLSADPFHSPNLSNRHVDARLAFPARVTAPWDAAQKRSQ